MDIKEYVEKYTHEEMGTDKSLGLYYTNVLSNNTNCYLTSYIDGKRNCIYNESLLKLLAEHNVTKVDTAYKDSNVASIGFSEKENKWYGWTHRGYCSFTIGSECKKGYVNYNPATKADYKEKVLAFHNFDADYYTKTWIENETEEGFDLFWEYNDKVPNEKIRGTIEHEHYDYPKQFGRGEWTAKTMDDAKQMAIDYANNLA